MFASFRSATLLLTALPAAAFAQAQGDASAHTLERITVTGGWPTTLPIEIPTTTEGISGQQVAQTINATDAQDALKYFPSLLVRKRYIGDYNHAVLSTRASGTGNSARSLVYADGVLLSNLLGNGASYTPRWGFGHARRDRPSRCDLRPVFGRLPGQLGRRGGRLCDTHAEGF